MRDFASQARQQNRKIRSDAGLLSIRRYGHAILDEDVEIAVRSIAAPIPGQDRSADVVLCIATNIATVAKKPLTLEYLPRECVTPFRGRNTAESACPGISLRVLTAG